MPLSKATVAAPESYLRLERFQTRWSQLELEHLALAAPLDPTVDSQFVQKLIADHKVELRKGLPLVCAKPLQDLPVAGARTGRYHFASFGTAR
jgi:hypothetical protein